MMLTTKNAKAVFNRILSMAKEDQKMVLDRFNTVLDELCEEDAFGTEGQNDPRGDHRD